MAISQSPCALRDSWRNDLLCAVVSSIRPPVVGVLPWTTFPRHRLSPLVREVRCIDLRASTRRPAVEPTANASLVTGEVASLRSRM